MSDNQGENIPRTTKMQVGQVKRGDHVMIDGNPCKVTDCLVTQAGKHGSGKVTVSGIDIFTNKKHQTNGTPSSTI